MEDQLAQLRNDYRQNQQTFRYYLIGLTVTAIGFAVYNTIGVPLKIIQIPLGIAVILWTVSVYSGFMFLKYNLAITKSNISYLEMTLYKGDYGRAAGLGIKEGMKTNISTANNYSRIQEVLFYGGIIFFIVWHVLEMYLTALDM